MGTALFIILLLVLIFGFSFFFGIIRFILNIFRVLFLGGRSSNKTTQKPPVSPKKKKDNPLFNKSEAEDADYEEIK